MYGIINFTPEERAAHVATLAKAYADELVYLDNYGFGAWGVDQLRPFGNTGVHEDILDILGIDFEDIDKHLFAYAEELYKVDLGVYIKRKLSEE